MGQTRPSLQLPFNGRSDKSRAMAFTDQGIDLLHDGQG